MTELNTCTKCLTPKEISEFGVFKQRGAEYRRGACHSCRSLLERVKRIDCGEHVRQLERNQYAKKKEENPDLVSDYYRNWHLRKKYDITLHEFEKYAAFLEYKCEICGNEEKQHKNLVVDHNHKTGKVRGLLCSSCNKGLGHFKDSPDALIKAFTYLKERGFYGS